MRVTVEDSCTDFTILITLNGRMISELTFSVCEYHLEGHSEILATKCLIEPVEYICYRPAVLASRMNASMSSQFLK